MLQHNLYQALICWPVAILSKVATLLLKCHFFATAILMIQLVNSHNYTLAARGMPTI